MSAIIVRPTATTMPFRIRMSCGHVEIRKMREALAGIPWTSTAELQAGAKCAECDPMKEAHRPNQRRLNAEYGL